MAHPPILPLPSGDSRSAATRQFGLPPRIYRLILGSLVGVAFFYQLFGTASFHWDVEYDQSPLPQQPNGQDRTSPLSHQWPKGQAPPQYPGGDSSYGAYPKELQEKNPSLGTGGAGQHQGDVSQHQQEPQEKHDEDEDDHNDDGEDDGFEEEQGEEEEEQDDTKTPSSSSRPPGQIAPSSSSNQKKLPPRLYDVILFNDELDLLEVRLNELENVVDIFVIIEAQETFQKGPKPLHFRLNERSPRFMRFKERILHIVVPPMSTEEAVRARQVGGPGWEAETYLRNKGLLMALDIFRPSVGDWVMHSDVDEIPRGRALEQLKINPNSLIPGRASETDPSRVPFLRLECALHYYSFEFKRARSWMGPALAQFSEASSDAVDVFADDEARLDANGRLVIGKPFWDDWPNIGYRLRMWIRNSVDVPIVPDACWHCSWCFATTDQYYTKASSYSHNDHNQKNYMNEKWIVQHVREGKDLFDRAEQKYDYVVNNDDIPEYINVHRDRFAYLLDRKGKANAGFTNVDEKAVDY